LRVLAICNQKGGCGKTITSINLGASLSFLGKKVLLIDLDPQAHSTIGLGVDSEALERSIFDVLNPESANRLTLQEVVIQVEKNLWLAPSQIVLTAIEQQLSGVPKREEFLSSALASVQKNYDFVLIDCPPNLGILTFNALRAAGESVITIEPSSFSVHGLEKVNETINVLREQIQHSVIVHALLTMLDNRNKFSRDVVDRVRKIYGDRVLRTVIRINIRLREAAQSGRPITRFDRHSTGFHDYLSLASEIIERGVKQQAEDAKVLKEEEKKLSELLTGGKVAELKTAKEEKDNEDFEKISSEEKSENQENAEDFSESEENDKPATETTPPSPFLQEDGDDKGSFELENAPDDDKVPFGISTPGETSPEESDERAIAATKVEPASAPKGAPTSEEKTPGSLLLPIRGIRKYPLKVSGGYLFICKCPGAKSVQIVGDFTNWIAASMNSPGGKSGFWTRVFSLTPGSHKYKFIVDGEWVNDINNSKYQRNPYGGIDSIIEVS